LYVGKKYAHILFMLQALNSKEQNNPRKSTNNPTPQLVVLQ